MADTEADVKGEFADYPVSLAEIRSEKSGNGADWSPREALIAALRQIDKGEIAPTALIVCWATLNADGTGEGDFENASPNAMVTLGLLARVAHRINVMAEPS